MDADKIVVEEMQRHRLCMVLDEAVGIASTAELGNRIGVATLLMLISFVGVRHGSVGKRSRNVDGTRDRCRS